MEETPKVDKRTQKTPEQLETLKLAREKANAIRSEKAQVKNKMKELKELSFQKDKAMVEKLEKKLKPAESESEEEIEYVKKPKKKKVVYVSDSEEEIEHVRKPKQRIPIDEKPAPVMARMEAQDHIRRIHNQRMRSMLFG